MRNIYGNDHFPLLQRTEFPIGKEQWKNIIYFDSKMLNDLLLCLEVAISSYSESKTVLTP